MRINEIRNECAEENDFMIDIEEKFQNILLKYKKGEINEEFCNLIKEKIVESLRPIIGKKVILRGAGRHTEQLLLFMEKNDIPVSIQALVDRKNVGITWNDIPIISKEDVKKYDFDAIIISSYKHRDIMKKDFSDLPEEKIIDIYDYLYENGIFINKPFYFYKPDGYEPVLYNIEQYKKKQNKQNLEKIIFSTILIKDFANSFEYIDEYITRQYDDGTMEQLREELKELCYEIFQAFQSREYQHDIIAFVLDSVPQKNIKWLPHICSKIGSSIYFTNAYTTCPYTTQSIRSFLNTELHIDDYEFYRQNLSLNEDNCELISYLKKQGYEFRYVVVDGVNCFNDHNYGISEETTCGAIIWKGIREILMSDKPMVCFMHPANETHYPNVSLYTAGSEWDTYSTNDIIKHNQHMTSYRYVDDVIAFYEKLMPNTIKIFMSDHGEHFVFPQFHFSEDKLSTILLVEAPEFGTQKIEKVFSWIEFPKLLKYLITGDETWIESINYGSALFQDIDFYNETWINKAVATGYQKYGMAYRGIITSDEKYVMLGDGTEFYYLNKDEKHNLINKEEYADRITELRKKVGNHFLDFNQYNELDKSYKLYL